MHSLMLVAIGVGLSVQVTDDPQRQRDFTELCERYDAALAAHRSKELPEEPTDAQWIEHNDAWPGWAYLPQFLELAQASPEDETALKCCQWIFDRCGNVGNSDKRILAVDAAAWQLIARHQTTSQELPLLCLRAVQYPSPAREQFLRELPRNYRQSVEVHGFAYLALAELLAHRYEMALGGGPANWPEPKTDLERHRLEQLAPVWKEYMSAAEPERLRHESCELFRHVLDHYSDIPVTVSAPYFRDIKTLGEKAAKSLHALEHLRVGQEAPPIAGTTLEGKELNLSDHRGRVVLLSFWFTGCGPCMALIPEERKLVEKYGDKGLAILGVCRDEDIIMGQRTAEDHNMAWPCWFDGEEQTIHADYNVLHWPTFYLINRLGKIASRDVSPDELESEIAKLLELQTGG